MLRQILALGIWGLASTAFAGTDERSTPCEWYGAADAVFIGEAGPPVQRWVHSSDVNSPLVPMKFSPVTIERAFRGVSVPTVFVTPAGIVEYLEPGKRYLIYGRKYGGAADMFMSGRWYGSKPLDAAEDDLRFLDRVAAQSTGNTISGVLELDQMTWNNVRSVRAPLPDVKIVVSKNEYRTETYTDSLGRFVVSGLPDGMFTIDPALPDNLVVLDEFARKIRVTSGGCASTALRAFLNGRIRGTITGGSYGVSIMLVPIGVAADGIITGRVPTPTVHTDANGRFEFAGKPPGRYWIRAEPTLGATFSKTYYPGTSDERAAVPVVVEPGGITAGIDFALAPPLAEGKIQVIVDAQGQVGTLSFCFTYVEFGGGPARQQVQTGQVVTIDVQEGTHYELHAHLEFPGGHLESAPAEIVGTSGVRVVRLVPDAPRQIHR